MPLKSNKKHIGISVYLYEYNNNQISTSYKKFSSVNELYKHTGFARTTISMYLDTYVPFKGYFFFTDAVGDLDLANKQIKDNTQGLKVINTEPIKIWMYFIDSNGEIIKSTSDSKTAVSKMLNVDYGTISNHQDKWIANGVNGYYLFSNELNDIELEKLKAISLTRKAVYCKVWAYNALTLELISKTFPSLAKAGGYFNVRSKTILSHLDTKIATKKGSTLVYFFSYELTDLLKKELLLNFKKAKNETNSIWVYKLLNSELVLLTEEEPTFKTIDSACKKLKISSVTIYKYLDSGKPYKNLYFYSLKPLAEKMKEHK